jgi:hypothetical protein
MIYQSNDIGRKVGLFANNRLQQRDWRERRFGQWRFNRDEKFTAFRRAIRWALVARSRW